MTPAFMERLAELLECDPDIGSLCAAALRRNRERDGMRRTIAELRGRVFRRNKKRCDGLTIGLDFDDTFTADTHFWSHFIADAQRAGHRVVCISARRESDGNRMELEAAMPEGVTVLLSYDAPKALFAKSQGIEVDVWIDDFPAGIPLLADIRALQ